MAERTSISLESHKDARGSKRKQSAHSNPNGMQEGASANGVNLVSRRLFTTLLVTSLAAGCAGTHGTRYVGHQVAQAPQHVDPQQLTDEYFPRPAEPTIIKPPPAPPAEPLDQDQIPPAPSSSSNSIPLPPVTTTSVQERSGLTPVNHTPILLRPISDQRPQSRLGGHSLRSF